MRTNMNPEEYRKWYADQVETARELEADEHGRKRKTRNRYERLVLLLINTYLYI